MKTIIHTPTNDLDKSIAFYRKLRFKFISESSPTLVTDGKVMIELNPERYARAGVKIYADSWTSALHELGKLTAITDHNNGHLLSDPSGVRIYLEIGDPPHAFASSDESFSILGNNAGISLETTDISKSMAIWKLLGFTHISGKIEQGWISCTNDDGLAVSLMAPNSCPHLFFNPSLTYFNGKGNIDIIDKVRALNIPIAEEITFFNKKDIVDNIIIRDPGGYGFFLFSD